MAKKKLKELKREARSVEHVKKLNKGLENKIISMQQKISELVSIFVHLADSQLNTNVINGLKLSKIPQQKEISLLKTASVELTETKQKLEALKIVEAELKTARAQLAERDVELNNLVNVMKQERFANEELNSIKEKQVEECEKRCEQLERDRESLLKDIESVKESASENKVNIEGNSRIFSR